jgi:hypothetical protein
VACIGNASQPLLSFNEFWNGKGVEKLLGIQNLLGEFVEFLVMAKNLGFQSSRYTTYCPWEYLLGNSEDVSQLAVVDQSKIIE